MTIFVQYFKDGGWTSRPPPPTVTNGQRIGAKLFLHNDHPDRETKPFSVTKKILNPDGNLMVTEEEAQNVSYGRVAFFPITTTNTQKAGNYLASFDVHVGGKWFDSWKGNPQVNPDKLIATVKDQQALPTNGDGDDITIPPPEIPPEEGKEYDVVKIGQGNFGSVAELQERTDWDAHFKSGDHGLAKIKFPIPLPNDLPDWLKYTFPFQLLAERIAGQPHLELSKAGISDYYNSYLSSKGVKLWRSVYWEGSYICIPFTTGLAALVVLAICGGIALIISAVGFTIALYKVGVKWIETEKEKEIEGQDQILDVIGDIEDPELQAEMLARFLNLKYSGASSKSVWEGLFGTPLLIIGVTISAVLIAIVAVKLLRR